MKEKFTTVSSNNHAASDVHNLYERFKTCQTRAQDSLSASRPEEQLWLNSVLRGLY